MHHFLSHHARFRNLIGLEIKERDLIYILDHGLYLEWNAFGKAKKKLFFSGPDNWFCIAVCYRKGTVATVYKYDPSLEGRGSVSSAKLSKARELYELSKTMNPQEALAEFRKRHGLVEEVQGEVVKIFAGIEKSDGKVIFTGNFCKLKLTDITSETIVQVIWEKLKQLVSPDDKVTSIYFYTGSDREKAEKLSLTAFIPVFSEFFLKSPT